MMTHSDDDLTRALQAQVDHMHEAPLQLSDVQGRATQIRRRRQAIGAGLAVAAVAVVVPSLMLAGNVLPQSSNDPDPGQSPTGDPTRVITPDELVLADLPSGAKPGVTYVSGNEIVEPDGTTTPVRHGYTDLLRTDSGWLGIRWQDGAPVLAVIETDGDETDASPSASRLVATADGTDFAAFYRESRTLSSWTTEGREPTQWTMASDWVEPVGILGTHTVVYADSSVDPVVMVASDRGTAPVPGLRTASDASEVTGRVAGMTRLVGDTGSCWAMVAPTGAKDWEQCDFTLGDISPDGSHVIGRPAYLDGIGDGEFAILDASTGDPLWSLQSTEAHPWFINDTVWEDDEHVLATVFQEGEWYVVRFGTDGSVEVALGPIEGSDELVPVTFSAR